MLRGSGDETLWSVMFPSPTSRPSQRTRPHVHHQITAPHHSAPLPPAPPPHHSAPLPPALPPHHYSNRMVPSNVNGNQSPYHPYLPPPVHVTPITTPPYLTAPPPPILYAAQTSNVLSVPVPTPSSIDGNPIWSFPVNVLPRDNNSASVRRGDGSVMNPLIVPPFSPGSGGRSAVMHANNTLPSGGGENSRAASVLGNRYSKSSHGYGLSSASASAAASVAGNMIHSMYSLTVFG